MARWIADKTLDELRYRCDIVELITSYVPLKRAGKNFSACCPFHEETKPSFMVNQERQIFKCFGCGKGGNVYHFMMHKERVGFFDAVRMVAERVGYDLPVENREASDSAFKKNDLFDAVAFAVRFYNALLDDNAGKKGREYLIGRGVRVETIEELKLGYAPGGNSLREAAKKKGFSDKVLEAAGLLVDDGEGRLRDKFYERVMFPVFDPQGRAIGFSGRVLVDREPKYMNSPETPLFSKSRILYGISFSRDEMMRQEHGIICEGHVDFITLYQSGIRNSVAAQGTAFTREQARLLKRYAPKVTFAFDSDSAGKKAVIRSLEPLLQAGLEVRVAEIPDGHDPDSFVREKGAEEFLKLVSESKDYFDFHYAFLTGEHDVSEQQGKLRVASEMLQSIKKAPSAIVRDEQVRGLSPRMGISEDALRVELRKIRGSYRPFSQKEQAGVRKLTAEEELIGYGIRFNACLDGIRNSVRPEDFQRPHCIEIAGILYSLAEEKEEVTFEDVLHLLQNEEQGDIVTELMLSDSIIEHSDETARELVNRVLMPKRIVRRDELKQLIREAGEGEGGIAPELQEEYFKLQRLLMRVKASSI